MVVAYVAHICPYYDAADLPAPVAHLVVTLESEGGDPLGTAEFTFNPPRVLAVGPGTCLPFADVLLHAA